MEPMPSAYPLLYVNPSSLNGSVGDTFTISVNIFNLTDGTAPDPDNYMTNVPVGNLYGFDIQLSWNSSVIGYVNSTKDGTGFIASFGYVGYLHPNVTVPVEKYPYPIPPSPYAGALHGYGEGGQYVIEIVNAVDEAGNLPGAADPSVRAWFSFASVRPAAAFNGNCTLLTMTFKILAEGYSPISIVDATLADASGRPIMRGLEGTWLNAPRDGEVIPEFPSLLILPMFMSTTLLAIIFTRKNVRIEWETVP
jgi:hypothetical protein